MAQAYSEAASRGQFLEEIRSPAFGGAQVFKKYRVNVRFLRKKPLI
jgi:hypothetical protein